MAEAENGANIDDDDDDDDDESCGRPRRGSGLRNPAGASAYGRGEGQRKGRNRMGPIPKCGMMWIMVDVDDDGGDDDDDDDC